jgi:chitodextrinase
MATVVSCGCESEKGELANLSWPRVKKGYEAMDAMYGVSKHKLNAYAEMAWELGDLPTAQTALAQIGDDWDKDVWYSQARFDRARAWAQNPELTASQQ